MTNAIVEGLLEKWRYNGGTMHPALADPTKFLVCQGVTDTGPRLKSLTRSEFPRSLLRSKINTLLNRGVVTNFKCFYTGVECYWVNWENLIHKQSLLPWGLNREHLVSNHNMDKFLRLTKEEKEKTDGNILYAGKYINFNIGHNPLPLKLLTKKHLETCEYDRNDHSLAAVLNIKRYIIEFEDQYKLGGLYPWQPWTYIDPMYKQAAIDLHNRMLNVELEFLKVPQKEKKEWLNSFTFNL